jgi:hypothetical protein
VTENGTVEPCITVGGPTQVVKFEYLFKIEPGPHATVKQFEELLIDPNVTFEMSSSAVLLAKDVLQ